MGNVESEFGKKMRAIRKLKGLNQAELGEMIGLKQTDISKIELGKISDEKAKNEVKKVLGMKSGTGGTGVKINADKLNGIMSEKGISSHDLAKKSGVSSSSINYYRRGDCQPGKTNFKAICYGLGVEPKELIKSDEDLFTLKKEFSATKEDSSEDLRAEIDCLNRKINQLVEDKKNMRKQIVLMKETQDCIGEEVSSNRSLIEKLRTELRDLGDRGFLSKIFG